VQAQSVLTQKLGVAADAPPADLDALQRCMATFTAPLSPSKQEVLQALFSPDFDPVAMNLNLAELQEEDL
jgi:hypothetical protein